MTIPAEHGFNSNQHDGPLNKETWAKGQTRGKCYCSELASYNLILDVSPKMRLLLYGLYGWRCKMNVDVKSSDLSQFDEKCLW